MPYALQSMLRIRGLREDRAQTAMVSARLARDLAERALEERQKRSRMFDAEKEPRRDRAFAAVMGRVVRREDLELVRESVTRIDEESMLLRRDVDKAASEHRAKETAAETARGVYIAAAKERMKIEEHRRLWEEEDRRQREALADAEMEEFAGRRLTADDDDSFD